MANSYQLHTANGSTTQFSFANIDGWINSGFLKVYVNGVLKTTGYNLIDLNTVNPKVEFLAGHIPTNGQIVVIQRETPATVSTFKANVVDFSDSSILTAADLDRSVEGILHITQEAEDTGSGAIGKTVDETNWDAQALRLTNLGDGLNPQDAATKNQLDTALLFGSGVVVPQAWSLTGANTATYTLISVPLNTDSNMFVVEVGGVIQAPTTYNITAETTTGTIVFDSTVATGVPITVRNFGVSRNIPNNFVSTGMIQNLAVTTAKINDLAVTTAKIADSNVTTGKIANDAVTYAKIQNVSATDRLLGRDTAAAGDIEELTVSGGIEFTGSGGIRTSAFTGDVTKATGGTVLTIGAGKVTSDKLDTNLAVSGNFSVGGTATFNSVGQSLINSSTATLSGSSTVISGIPSWARRVTVTIQNLSTTGTNVLLMQAGHSGSLQTSLYSGLGSDYVASNTSTGQFTWGPATSFVVTGSYDGRFVLERMGTTNTWVGSGNIANTSSGKFHMCVGEVALQGTLDRIGLLVTAPQTFDAGTMCVAWE
jgi:hypothetical protein